MEMTKESLAGLKVRELADICRKHNIPCYRGKNLMHKDEIIAAIIEAKLTKDGRSETQSAGDKTVIGDGVSAEAGAKENKPASTYVIDMARKMPYIESAQVGTLVAFRLANGKVKSAKIIKRSTKNRRFMLETEYGAQYVVSYDDIVWVRTTKRWPLGVYKLLKGLGDDGRSENQ